MLSQANLLLLRVNQGNKLEKKITLHNSNARAAAKYEVNSK